MDKTVVVAVEDRVKHALYGKVIRRTDELKAHDEQNAAGVGEPSPSHGDPCRCPREALARLSRSSRRPVLLRRGIPAPHPSRQAEWGRSPGTAHTGNPGRERPKANS
ncbi:hypothetical protein SBADM41S_00821 [Streptomyces badius]